MKSLLEVFEEACCIHFSITLLLMLPPRRSFPYPTLFQVTFCISRVERSDWHLASGELASERNLAILEKYEAGYTLFQLAEMFHLSYQRVHQIIQRTRR
jgi:DNA-directed RNA polymerase specialized sigma24 family protein